MDGGGTEQRIERREKGHRNEVKRRVVVTLGEGGSRNDRGERVNGGVEDLAVVVVEFGAKGDAFDCGQVFARDDL